MTIIKKSALVPYTQEQMFHLVDGIEEYPQFLPWCKSSIVHSRSIDEVKASILISKGPVQHSFSTINRLQKNRMIEVKLLEGPFKQLEGFWRFETVGTGCQVVFNLEFEFKNKLLALTLGPVIQKIAENFVEAFYKRAKEIYGE